MQSLSIKQVNEVPVINNQRISRDCHAHQRRFVKPLGRKFSVLKRVQCFGQHLTKRIPHVFVMGIVIHEVNEDRRVRHADACGYRLPASSTLCFAKRCVAVLPPGLAQALGPVLEQIAEMTKKIKHYDRLIKRLTETEYPETQALIQVYGVGQLTALTYVLTLGNKERFQRSRDVGCYLGLRPKRSQSGDRDPQLGITKAGNIYLRTLLVECANHVLGPHGRDSTLRQWGLHLASRGGKQSRNRAIVAVARKLAVLLHRIWITQEPYIPFYGVAA